jgi:hypothetical protein
MLSGGGGARRSRGASRRSRGVSHPSWGAGGGWEAGERREAGSGPEVDAVRA